jgi:hypothetical protein
MYSRITEVSPEGAAHILANKNPRNRPLSRERVRRYAAEMEAGRWKLTHQGLAFDADDNLLDGQHRLAAVKLYGKPVSFYVAYEAPQDTFGAIDTGITRTAAQALAIELKAHSLDSERPPTATSASKYTAAARTILELGLEHAKPSNMEIVDYAIAHTEVLDRYSKLAQQWTAGTHAAFAFAELQGLKGVREAADRLADLNWTGEDDPMRALAKALGNMGGRDGAKAKQTRFYTTLGALSNVNDGTGLLKAIKYDSMPRKAKESVFPKAMVSEEMASHA